MTPQKLLIVTTLLLLVVTSAVFAQTQAEMNKEACDEYKKADVELNAVYQQVLRENKGQTLFLKKMQAAQRAWLVYRDAHLAALYPGANPQAQYGSVYASCRCFALADTTRKRVDELKLWSTGVPEGDVCTGSGKVRLSEVSSAGVPEYERLDSVFRKKWKLTKVGDRELSGAEVYLEFDVKQGRFTGTSGCNRILCGYHVDSTELRFTAVARTKLACLDSNTLQTETTFIKALEQTTRFKFEGNVITVYTSGGTSLTFTAE